MKAAIIYASFHHGNTKKVVEAIAKETDVALIDSTTICEKDLSEYDLLGFASGQYFSKFHQAVLNFASINLPQNKKVFFITTYGGRAVWKSMEAAIKGKNAEVVGKFACKGYDTYGPFKLVGGIAKKHPTEKDLADAVDFFKGLVKENI